MKREYPDAALVGVGSIIIQDGKVLLVKRGHPPLLGEWSIPGGVLEVGETLRAAAVREAKEETGLIVEPAELLGVFDRVIRDDKGRVRYHYVLIDFLCRQTGGILASSGDAAEVQWFEEVELAALKLAPDTEQVVRKGFRTVGSGGATGETLRG